jgi:2-polyprenyl-3-methyl-5-hydroxy-6-metoxy-1,4-benzoquinol methylase
MNKIKELLLELKISTEDSIIQYHNKVRDREDVQVLKCTTSDVIFLSSTDHIDRKHYETTNTFEYWSQSDRKSAINSTFTDDSRRSEQFRELITNKKWLDVGAGAGGVLEILNNKATISHAVEIQKDSVNTLRKLGFDVFEFLDDVSDNFYDVITLFHVFEHFTNPIEELIKIKSKLNDGGKLIIEVPHARDILISLYENEAFKNFTFWSEHLILHTRNSLRIFVENVGFKNVNIKGFQRYPLSNHLYWLNKNKPGGHVHYNMLNSTNLNHEYSSLLSSLDANDTLILIAEN